MDTTLRAFLDELASDSPVPGGGSVSALAGALAGALIAMVAGLTSGREKYAAVQNEVEDLLAEAKQVREALEELVDDDIDVYAEVAEAMRLPKDTEDEREERERRMQSALKRAADVPLAVGEQALRAAGLTVTAARIGNRNAVSDAGVAALLCDAAARGAALNVEINLKWIDDEAYSEAAWSRVLGILEESGRLSQEALALVAAELR